METVVFIITSYMSVGFPRSFIIIVVVGAAGHVHYSLACFFKGPARPCTNAFPNGINNGCDADGDGERVELPRPIASIAANTANAASSAHYCPPMPRTDRPGVLRASKQAHRCKALEEMLCPTWIFVFKEQSARRTSICHGRDWIQVQVEDRVCDKAQGKHRDNKDGKRKTDLRGRATDPVAPCQALQLISIPACGTLVVVPLLQWIRHTPGTEAVLVHVLLAAFAFARSQHAATLFRLVSHARLGI